MTDAEKLNEIMRWINMYSEDNNCDTRKWLIDIIARIIMENDYFKWAKGKA
jgi:hypothetical protein